MTSITKSNLGERMKQKRFTQVRLAQASGLSQGEISYYVRGREPRVRRAIQIAKALGTTVEQIWAGVSK